MKIENGIKYGRCAAVWNDGHFSQNSGFRYVFPWFMLVKQFFKILGKFKKLVLFYLLLS